MGFRILDSSPGARRAAVDGELTIYTAAVLKGEIEQALAEPGGLEVDLSAVTEADTAGLQWMLMAKRQSGGALSFVRPSPAVLQMLELTNLAGTVGDMPAPPRDPVQP